MMPERSRRARDSRLLEAPSIGPAGLAKLRASKVAILGVGNIGGHLAQHFVLLGAQLVLVDRDIVEESNLGTQAFTEEQLGVPKVQARVDWLRPLNPWCPIEPVHRDVADLGLGALRDVDLICCCLDNSAIRIVVNEIATRLGAPWIDAALDGSGKTLFGRVAAYDTRDQHCGCYLCPHTSATLAQMRREEGHQGCAAMAARDRVVTAPTLAVSALGAAAASLQAAWSLGILLHRDNPVTGREAYFNLDAGRMTTHQLPRNPQCLFDHRRYSLQPLNLPAGEATVARTFDVAECSLGAPVTLELQRRVLIGTVRCEACGAVRHPWRIAQTLHEFACACGAAMQPLATDLLERFGRDEAAAVMDRTWSEIGVPPMDVVVASSDGAQLELLLDS
jgi:molybdopterin/thiamine biosynthesis adenylyltransferase